MADKRYLDELMEHMRQGDAIFVGAAGERRVPVSALMLREVMRRSEAAESKEEGDRMLRDFFMEVIQGKITPYH